MVLLEIARAKRVIQYVPCPVVRWSWSYKEEAEEFRSPRKSVMFWRMSTTRCLTDIIAIERRGARRCLLLLNNPVLFDLL